MILLDEKAISEAIDEAELERSFKGSKGITTYKAIAHAQARAIYSDLMKIHEAWVESGASWEYLNDRIDKYLMELEAELNKAEGK